MAIPLRLRLLEWAADHSARVQYPRPVRDAQFHWLRWKYPMPLWQRFSLALLFAGMSALALVLLVFVLFIAGAIFYAIF